MSLFSFSYKKTMLIAFLVFGAIYVKAQEEPISAFAKKKATNKKNESVKRELFLEKNLGYRLAKNLIGLRFDKNGSLLNTPVMSHSILLRRFSNINNFHQFDFVNPDNKFIVPRMDFLLPIILPR